MLIASKYRITLRDYQRRAGGIRVAARDYNVGATYQVARREIVSVLGDPMARPYKLLLRAALPLP